MKQTNKQTMLILICDDDKADIKILESYLRADKDNLYSFIEARNTNEIEFALNENKGELDLIFLDYQMPDKTGIEWLVELKELNYAPVIMLTGHGDESTAVEAMKLGASEYLPKDKLDKFNLIKAMQNAFERWELENERNALLGIAAHEFRNPLTTIIGYTQMLQTYDELEKSKKDEMLSHIHERADHILLMINSLLDVTRIGLGTINLEIAEYDIVEFIKSKMSEYEIKANEKNINIEFNSEAENLKISFDKSRIDEVLSNLVDNAIKYSPEHTEVKIKLLNGEKSLAIQIMDEGPGIKESELKYLFKLFSNVNISTKPTAGEKSTGLGLAICKKIMSLHKGNIEVESKINEGSTFRMNLPLN